MKLLVGLGNPGDSYEKTRHNLGFMLVEHFFQDFEPVQKTVWDNSKKFKSDIAEITWERKQVVKVEGAKKIGKGERVILAKPKTYMNNSGMVVKLLTDYYKITPSDVWIFHDELDLPLGMLKIRFGGASAGHHGVDSVINALGTDKFWRFRLGIGKQRTKGTIADHMIKNAEEFVLQSFTGAESRKIKELLKRGVKAIETGLEKDLPAAMNQFNTR